MSLGTRPRRILLFYNLQLNYRGFVREQFGPAWEAKRNIIGIVVYSCTNSALWWQRDGGDTAMEWSSGPVCETRPPSELSLFPTYNRVSYGFQTPCLWVKFSKIHSRRMPERLNSSYPCVENSARSVQRFELCVDRSVNHVPLSIGQQYSTTVTIK